MGKGSVPGVLFFILSILLKGAQHIEEPREHRVGPGSVGRGLSICSLPAAVHGSRPEEVIDHRLTEREWAEEWKHLNNVSVQTKA